MKTKIHEYTEVKMPKGAAGAIFDGFNDDMKPKRVNANGTKKQTGRTTSQKSYKK